MRSIARLSLILSLLGSAPVLAQGNMPESNSNSREFIASCTYGVLAGTLVGAASLAFTDRPGDNLNRVARGASLGLYTGILLGVYVVYIVPGMQSSDDEDPIARLAVTPTDGFDGATAQAIFSF